MNKKFNKNNKLIGEKNVTYTSFSNRFMERLDFSANSNGIHNPATHFGNYRGTHVSREIWE